MSEDETRVRAALAAAGYRHPGAPQASDHIADWVVDAMVPLLEQARSAQVANKSPVRTHELKTWTEYFEACWSGDKTCEVRVDDRAFALGDELVLLDYDREKKEYKGRALRVLVTHVLREPFAPSGSVIMSFRRLEKRWSCSFDGVYSEVL